MVEGGIRDGVGVFGEVKASVRASLLPVLNPWTGLWPANLSYSSVRLAERLTQRLCQAQDPEAIAMEI